MKGQSICQIGYTLKAKLILGIISACAEVAE